MKDESYFLGIHTGRVSLKACFLAEDGTSVASAHRRFRNSRELHQALQSVLEELQQLPFWGQTGGAAIGLEKAHRCGLPAAQLEALLPAGVPLQLIPSQLAILLGAVPHAPSLLVSLGADLRLASLDSAHNYREFRLQEGGGLWWTGELPRLAQHSLKLQRALAPISNTNTLLKSLPQLLENADYPAPDPVLKARMDGLCANIANRCLYLASRQPGIRYLSLAGYLFPSTISRRIVEGCSEHLRHLPARFPAEVGAALVGLALYKENQEREHLGKAKEDGRPTPTQKEISPVLLRRLYKIRRPFERFVAVVPR